MYTLSNLNMKKLGSLRSRDSRRRAISPVIATIILIAITIVIAIAVAGWVFGLFGSYSRQGGVTILASASNCTPNECTIVVVNQGSTGVTVISASVNGNPVSFTPSNTSVAVSAGQTATVHITVPNGVQSGQTLNVQLGLSNGNTISTTLVVS